MSYYQKRKEAAREEAKEYQQWQSEQNLSWWDCEGFAIHFEELGKRYGLLKEFRENGII